ncbi:P-aminobenzoate N-oxygenase AurF family protein [Mycobacterium kansasii]|uniref:p-aminobenzoate N-oxygenase AurF family protein n=1 Tax=Mycobacterium kansasii TaxID=1768 RepID=A0A1V3XH40_MYCKA|nr:P-aminobenzoate N-oxygenase AurF family protein [Mycobacterium kansasii]
MAALIGEEIFDSLQRQMMDDPDLQPIIQRLMRIHVTEEARHIQFARDGARKRAAEMPRLNRWFMANINGLGGYFFRYLFSNPIPYARAGLDPKRARMTARNSPHRHQMQIAGFAPLAAFLTEVGLMGPIARRAWKRSKFL